MTHKLYGLASLLTSSYSNKAYSDKHCVCPVYPFIVRFIHIIGSYHYLIMRDNLDLPQEDLQVAKNKKEGYPSAM